MGAQAPLSIAALADVERLDPSIDGRPVDASSGEGRGKSPWTVEVGAHVRPGIGAASSGGSLLHSSLPPHVSQDTSRTSAYTSAASEGSAGSDQELNHGTAELLLLHQSTGASCAGSGGPSSCQPSPMITATAAVSTDMPEIEGGDAMGGVSIAATAVAAVAPPPPDAPSAEELLLLNKRPRT